MRTPLTAPQSARLQREASPLDGGAAARAIVEATARVCAERFSLRFRALVLTGSLARDEATFAREREGLVLLGDAEFLLVFHEHAPLPEEDAVAAVARVVEDELRQQGLRGKIGLSACHEGLLRGMGPQIFAYELRACGRVVWGDRDVLSLIPRFAADDLDPADAWTLLCNRLVEQLGAIAESDLAEGAPPSGLHYHTIKLWLDMATSFLVFAGGYSPTYRGRADSLSALAARPALSDAPFDLPRFASCVQACTRFKLGTAAVADLGEAGSWREAVAQARRLWRWELSRLTGARRAAADDALRKQWMRQQPWASRARGWAYAVRRHGWHRSWRYWPRWTRLAWRASPRHWIYAAATDLVFALASPGGMAGDEAPVLGGLARRLPVCDVGAEENWRAMASQIHDEYRTLLVETRA